MTKYSFTDIDAEELLKLMATIETKDDNKAKEKLFKLDRVEKRKKRKKLSDEQRKRIFNSGIRKEVDEETFWNNLESANTCNNCIKNKNCEKKYENWHDDCKDWEYFLKNKEIEKNYDSKGYKKTNENK